MSMFHASHISNLFSRTTHMDEVGLVHFQYAISCLLVHKGRSWEGVIGCHFFFLFKKKKKIRIGCQGVSRVTI